MPKGEYMGELEQVVFLAVARLGGNAYGVTIRREVESRAGRTIAIGALYTTLGRMEGKGYISSNQGDDSERDGFGKRYFKPTGTGMSAYNASRQMIDVLAEGLKFDTATTEMQIT